jgi:cell division protease FtsH
MFLYGKKNSNSKLDNLIFKDMKDLDVTTGASNDLQQAKKIARNYVTQFGFSENVGLFDDLSNSELPFIGKELGTSNKISEKSRQDVDSEISKLIDFALSSALKLINLHQEQFLEIVDLLTKERTISGKDISKILDESNLI